LCKVETISHILKPCHDLIFAQRECVISNQIILLLSLILDLGES
jgi:hypothetical protein